MGRLSRSRLSRRRSLAMAIAAKSRLRLLRQKCAGQVKEELEDEDDTGAGTTCDAGPSNHGQEEVIIKTEAVSEDTGYQDNDDHWYDGFEHCGCPDETCERNPEVEEEPVKSEWNEGDLSSPWSSFTDSSCGNNFRETRIPGKKLCNPGSHHKQPLTKRSSRVPTATKRYRLKGCCLLCSSDGGLRKISHKGNYTTAEANFDAMFILKKMLSVSRDELIRYLQEYGSPYEWMAFCGRCILSVEEALKIQREIMNLEATLRKCQEGMISKIEMTWKKNNKTENTFDAFDSNCQRSPVHEIRQLISERRRAPGANSYVKKRRWPSQTQKITTSTKGPNNVNSILDDCDDFGSEEPMILEDGESDTLISGMEKIDRGEVEALQSGQYDCHLCPSLPKMALDQFANHVMFHNRRPLKCTECNLYYSNGAELVNYSTAKRNSVTHACSTSTVISTKWEPVSNHIWKCDLCPEKFVTETEKDLHVTAEHSLAVLEERKKYWCKSCPRKYCSLGEWRLHRAIEHPEVAIFSCTYCDLSFKCKSKEGIDFCDTQNLQAHLKKDHQALRPNTFTVMKLPEECDLCGTPFPRPVELNEHIITAHHLSRSDSYACPVCNYRTHERKAVEKHLNNRHRLESRTNVCDACGYRHKQSLSFEEHQFTEHGIIPKTRPVLSCPICGCSFQCVDNVKMRRHLMKEHGLERKHKCTVCGKGFLDSSKLKDHEQIHLNANLKPFQCEICGNSFAVKNYLYIHMRLSHQNRPFASTHKKKPTRSKRKSFTDTEKTKTVPGTTNEHIAPGEIQRNPTLFGYSNANDETVKESASSNEAHFQCQPPLVASDSSRQNQSPRTTGNSE